MLELHKLVNICQGFPAFLADKTDVPISSCASSRFWRFYMIKIMQMLKITASMPSRRPLVMIAI
jgi:hypothetical protein